ncbi:hypothetical protein DPMN_111147 [Dreissena polymorpha]|uniref:Uncharacterized protein n=1 Tax=Dreissena polymorpha TaxID=45954 RepID=A0A9D4KEI9_DREPO|nr:hypothetical protein DPMN_111147 [Dreissena polymorpha]
MLLAIWCWLRRKGPRRTSEVQCCSSSVAPSFRSPTSCRDSHSQARRNWSCFQTWIKLWSMKCPKNWLVQLQAA